MLQTMSANAKSWWATTVARQLLKTAGAFLLALGLVVLAGAQSEAQHLQDPETIGTLNKIEQYLTDLTTLKSRFIQANPDGSYVEGTIYLNRPGQMRVEYDEPVPILLVSTGNFFIHVDKRLKQVSHIPLSSTPAYLILQETIDFDQGLDVIGFERHAGLVRVALTQTDDPDLGSIELTFTQEPFALKQWTITDAQQANTTVTLLDPRRDVELDDDLFYFHNPWDSRDK